MKADDEVVVQYRLRCSSPMAAYALAFNREVSGIEAELGVTYFQGNGTPKDQSFNCGGDLPGLGVSCVGVYKGGYNTIRGLVSISLTEQEVADQVSLCKLGLTASLATFTSEVNRDQFSGKAKSNPDGTSQIANFAAGPFRVTFPQCHKGAKAAAAARR
jgi:hypothetical protein